MESSLNQDPKTLEFVWLWANHAIFIYIICLIHYTDDIYQANLMLDEPNEMEDMKIVYEI